MNFFEQELRKLFDREDQYGDTKFVGRACYKQIAETTNAKMEFVELGHGNHYSAIRVTIIDKNDGQIDNNLIRFRDLFGDKPIRPNSADMTAPHIWTYDGKTEWYGYQLTPEDYEMISDEVYEHLEVFGEPTQEFVGQTMQ